MFDATLYINQNMLYLIPVLYFIGMFIRSLQKVPNKFIPFILLALAIIISFAILGLTKTALAQGVLIAGTAVFVNQMFQQFIPNKNDK